MPYMSNFYICLADINYVLPLTSCSKIMPYIMIMIEVYLVLYLFCPSVGEEGRGTKGPSSCNEHNYQIQRAQ